MTPVFCCGFECGVNGSVGQHWNSLTSASFNTNASFVRNGARSLRVNPTAALSIASLGIGALTNINVIRFYIYFTTLPAANMAIMQLNTVNVGIVFKQSDSSLYLSQASNTDTPTGTGISVTTGRWYLIDFKANTSANPWAMSLSVDGGTPVTDSKATGATTPGNLFFGSGTSSTCDFYIDDFVLSQTNGDYPIGAGYVNHFIPTSDGTHNIAGTGDFQRTLTGTDILNATTTAFQLVDDVPLESGVSVDWINMVAPPNATDYVECIFGPASGISTPTAGPRAVEVIAGIHHAGTGTGNMEIRMNDNGTTNAMYTATTVAGVTSVNYKRKHYATAINGGGAWTVVTGAGNFNNLRMRFGSPAAVDANPDQYLDCIMIEAEFATVVVITIPNKIYQISQAVNRSNTY